MGDIGASEIHRAKCALALGRTRRLTVFLGVLVGAALSLAPGAFAANSIYWNNYAGNAISLAGLSGGSGADLATTGAADSGPFGTAIDPATGKIYWANYNASKISYANLDGTGGGDLTITGTTVDMPWGVAIDPAAGRIYWANSGAPTNNISFTNLDGTGGGVLVTTGATVNLPSSVAVDPATGKIYWTNWQASNISFANLNGTGGGDLNTTGATVTNPAGVAVDNANGKIYWTNYSGANKISFANVNNTGGGGDLTITGTTANIPTGLAIDPGAGKLYWANFGNNTVSSANLDGSGASNLTTTGATTSHPAFPSLLEAPSASGAPAVSGGSTTPATLGCSQGSWAGDVPESFLYRAPHSFVYQWYLNGTAIPGATSASYGASAAGRYTCTVMATNQAGSGGPENSAPFTITPPPATLAVSKSGSGTGTITSVPGPISCGSICLASFPFGTVAQLTAAPATGSRFAGWSGACAGTTTCAVTMSANQAVAAAFARLGIPDTKITKATISAKKRSAAFKFKATGTATAFQCALVKQAKAHHKKAKVAFKRCGTPKRYTHLKSGRYTFSVRAVGANGADKTPATKSFKIS
jgi:hypothetical protein